MARKYKRYVELEDLIKIIVSTIMVFIGLISVSSLHLNEGFRQFILAMIGLCFVLIPLFYWFNRATSPNYRQYQ
ncbi:MAG: hypothetical protein AABX29_02210 [Nanoarchaeota archaeon]